MKKSTTVRLAGFALLMAAVWGGGYLLHDTRGFWWEFPVLMTSLLTGVTGVVAMAVGDL